MAQALLWIDDLGGVIWLHRYWQWVCSHTFTWDNFTEADVLSLRSYEVSILSGLSSERWVWDSVPIMKPWDKGAMIRHKLHGYFPDTVYRTGEMQGKLNALQRRFCAMALPPEVLDKLLTYLYEIKAVCKNIIPVASLVSLMVQQKRWGKSITVLFYRQMHIYFSDDLGLRFLRVLDLPRDMVTLGEEFKKIYRYLVGQKWLTMGTLLKVHCLVLEASIELQYLPMIDDIHWSIHYLDKSLAQLSRLYPGRLNCISKRLQTSYWWHVGRRFACYGTVIIGLAIGYEGKCVWKEYHAAQQELEGLRAGAMRFHKVKALPKLPQTLLAIDTYQRQYAYPDYEPILTKLAQVLSEFPSWVVESIDWQREGPHKIEMVGEWKEKIEVESMSNRLERALQRQMQTKEIHTTAENQFQHLRIEMLFDLPVEE